MTLPNPEARVLLVDDDRELCQMLTEYLNAEHFDVTSVHDGGDALEKLRTADFEILILDVMLPSVGGFDVLRKLGASYQTPILMLTARGDDIDRIVGLELGADDYLSKPFNPRELVARINA
ncbi:MAG TPA: response regulator, partial [Steroidobacteraceae bacterium]|nr:response regulator [Steroidobacteraceae bacterium]